MCIAWNASECQPRRDAHSDVARVLAGRQMEAEERNARCFNPGWDRFVEKQMKEREGPTPLYQADKGAVPIKWWRIVMRMIYLSRPQV